VVIENISFVLLLEIMSFSIFRIFASSDKSYLKMKQITLQSPLFYLINSYSNLFSINIVFDSALLLEKKYSKIQENKLFELFFFLEIRESLKFNRKSLEKF